jgi:PEP-CTERM motif
MFERQPYLVRGYSGFRRTPPPKISIWPVFRRPKFPEFSCLSRFSSLFPRLEVSLQSKIGSRLENFNPVFIQFQIIFDVGPGGTCDAGDTCVLAGIDFSVPTTFTPVSGTLTVHFNDEIETFNFHYLSNVPEPVTLVLVGTGLVGIGWQKYRAKKSFPA